MKKLTQQPTLQGGPAELISTYTLVDDLTRAEMESLAHQAEDQIGAIAAGLRGLGVVMTLSSTVEDCPADDMSRVWGLVIELGSQLERLNTARSNLGYHLNNREIGR
ncbi:hypothetical protein ACETWN_18325 [Aeromonas hydrophila]|uniref:hypothetical protein n=1 Tax=Aeromonas hydrophila TaxID=644 RepID=UPI0035A33C13